jgi:F-type H+-transporting ATPase subunit delta
MERIEEYAHALFNAAVAEGHIVTNVDNFRDRLQFEPEVAQAIGELEREKNVELITQAYRRLDELVEQSDGVAKVTVTTAVPMDDALRAKVHAKAVELFRVTVLLEEKVDPKILGGIIIEGKGRRYDASVKERLATIRTALSSTYMGGE